MTDIRERLLLPPEHMGITRELRYEAAAEIERLRAALERFVRALDSGHAPALEDYDAARMALRHPDSAPRQKGLD